MEDHLPENDSRPLPRNATRLHLPVLTRRGRAELHLAERAASWNAKPENRHLPSWWEFLSIRALTKKKAWTESQSDRMRRAGRVLGLRWGSGFLLTLLVLVFVQQIVSTIRMDNLSDRTETAVASMSTSRGVLVPRAIEDLRVLPRDMVLAEMSSRFADSPEERKLSLAYALAHFDDVRIDFLISQIKTASREEVDNLVTALGYEQEAAIAALKTAATQCKSDLAYKGRLAVVALHLSETGIASDMRQLRPDPIQRTILIDTFESWHGDARTGYDGRRDFGRSISLGNLSGCWKYWWRGGNARSEASVGAFAVGLVWWLCTWM